MTKRWIWLFFALVLLAGVGGWRELRKTRRDVAKLKSHIAALKEEMLLALLAEKTDEICAGAKSEQDECLAIATWVAGHIVNIKQWQGSTAGDCYAQRYGFCRSRSSLFMRMCAFRGIPARVFNIYNFGGPGGHSCAQAYYDNAWHFYDPTYAGVFMRDGKVLSWEEIVSDPTSAIAGMVVFKETLDHARAQPTCDMPVGPRLDNEQRMKSVYTVENIRRARMSAGFLRSPEVKILEAQVNLANGGQSGLTLGKIDDECDDVDRDGMAKGVSQLLGYGLGNKVDTFYVQWNLSGVRAGQEYALRYHLCDATHPGLGFWVKAEDADIICGESFASSWLLTHDVDAIWEIRFRSRNDRCRVTIGYNFREPGRLLYVDQIELLPLSQ